MQSPITFILFRAGRYCCCAGLALVLSGCAGRLPPDVDPPPLLYHGHLPSVPRVDPLEVSPDMKAFVERYVAPYGDARTRLNLLMTAVFDASMLGFEYDESLSLTAPQAFEARLGNCIGFSNLMVALAREAGLHAGYQQVDLPRAWYSKDQTLMMVQHVNVLVHLPGESFMLDNSGIKLDARSDRRPLRDDEALALYYNNRGVEAMVAGDVATAWAWLVQATRAAPRQPDAWINLGVVYSRNRQLEAAEAMYRMALLVDPDQASALSNLYELYIENGQPEMAVPLERRVERYRRKNPYHLMALGYEALEESRAKVAVNWFDQAIQIKADEHQFHYGRAQALYLAGDRLQADSAMQRARELAPSDWLPEYSRPLSEVVKH